jgi:hypothetical protein
MKTQVPLKDEDVDNSRNSPDSKQMGHFNLLFLLPFVDGDTN